MPFRKSSEWGRTQPPPGATIDPRHWSSANLLGAWLFNVGAGSIIRAAAGPDAVMKGTIKWGPGPAGKALDVNNAAAAYVGTDIFRIDSGAFVSLCAWVRLPSNNANNVIISKSKATGGDPRNYEMGLATTIQWVHTATNGAYHVWNSTSSQTTLGLLNTGWHFLVFTYQMGTGSSMRCYVDGKSVGGSWTAGTGNIVHTQDVNENVSIGGQWTGSAVGASLLGSLAQARIYKKILSATEILALFNEPYAGFVSPRRRMLNTAPAVISRKSDFFLAM